VPTWARVFDLETLESEVYDFETYTGVDATVGYNPCTGTFYKDSCDGSNKREYDYSAYIGEDSFYELNRSDSLFELNPGESYDFLHGVFTPRDGVFTPSGEYTFYRASLYFRVYGLNADGEEISSSTQFATTCPSNDDSCAFTRNITAVPIPAAFWFFF
jgi:hypothetical protein